MTPMSTENTIFASNIYITAAAYAVMTALGTLGLVNIFNGEVKFGIGFLSTFLVLLVIYYVVDKYNHRDL